MSRTVADSATGARPAHVEALTGLRAVAASWVVLLHAQGFLAPYLNQVPVLRSLVSSGWLGVDLFFVLSGFVIGRSYVSELSKPRVRTVGRFLGNRVARVWPAWAVVTVLMGAWVWGMRRAGMNADVLVTHADASLTSLARQLSMTHMWGEPDFYGRQFLLPGWSISAEWLAYLCFPLVAVVLHRLRRLPAWLLLALAVAVMAPEALHAYFSGEVDGAQNWLVRIACGFTAGVLAALASRRFERTARVESAAFVGATLSVVGIVVVSLWSAWVKGAEMADYSGMAVVFFPVLVVSLTFTDRGVAAFLARPGMVLGGRMSYCLYLVHYAVLDVVVTTLWQDPARAFQATPQLVLIAPVLVVVPFGLAYLLHMGIEEPGRRLLLRLFRISKPQPFTRAAAHAVAHVAVAHASARPVKASDGLGRHAVVPAPRAGARRVRPPQHGPVGGQGPATAQLPAPPPPPFPTVSAHDPRRRSLSAKPAGGHHAADTRTVRTVA